MEIHSHEYAAHEARPMCARQDRIIWRGLRGRDRGSEHEKGRGFASAYYETPRP
jgi:hypothetical protein